ncbi:hypothetical protein MTO96_016850 [Rhipicephalus appendiculatus]
MDAALALEPETSSPFGALSAVCLLCALVHIEAGGGGYGGGAVAVATPVIAKTTPIFIAASKPALPSMGNAGHYLGYAGNVFEQLLRFSGHYGLPRGGGGGGGKARTAFPSACPSAWPTDGTDTTGAGPPDRSSA